MALTDAKIRAAKPTDKAYKLTDGAGMFLLVHPNGSRYWRLRYRILGKEKTLALGVYPEVSLSEARTKRDEARKLISEGIDPCEQKRVKKVVPDLQLSFEHIARRWHASNKQWAQSHSDKVLKSLETHVFPFIGNRDITTLSTPDLLIPVRAAEAKQIYEIASRLQQRISAVMRYAVQSGIIRYNPALDMAGALTTVKRQHRPALELSRLPELLSRIDGYKGQPVTRLAVMLNLLVFIRSSELRYARWSEIDIDNSMWTIPAEREPLPGVKFSHRGSKMRTPHLVPLSQQAVAILADDFQALLQIGTRFFFPGKRADILEDTFSNIVQHIPGHGIVPVKSGPVDAGFLAELHHFDLVNGFGFEKPQQPLLQHPLCNGDPLVVFHRFLPCKHFMTMRQIGGQCRAYRKRRDTVCCIRDICLLY